MRLRIADRILVCVAGILLLACFAGIVAQMFFGADLIGLATRLFTSESIQAKAILIGAALILLLLGIYCVLVLFRHRKRKDKFILQKNEGGELAISINALENMVQKCLDQHPELDVQKLYMENRKDGLLIRIRGGAAGGISIPLTVETLQKKIRQYVTACSGVEVKGIRVQIESSGEDAKDAPFAIAAPASKPLLGEKEEPPKPAVKPEEVRPAVYEPVSEAPAVSAAPAPVAQERHQIPEMEEDDDRPLHQRLFSPKQEACIVPEPPEEKEWNPSEQEPDQAESAGAAEDENGGETEDESEARGTEETAAREEAEMTEETPAEAAGAAAAESEHIDEAAAEASEEPEPAEQEEAPKDPREALKAAEERADAGYLDSLRAFDDLIRGDAKEDNAQ
ncbi:MAG: alkaline shock response membrane anchor protein AmaP [Clostridia bacterium]|nr:alkaline shock response membrane anchor protein AmaP [Clostridia bacterium]